MLSNTSQTAFARLCAVFDEMSEGPDTMEFEVLPKALQGSGDQILRDGQCIGVPKSLLVQAFIAARIVVVGQDSGPGLKNIHVATAVMLLFDPEQLTAANARKRCLQHLQQLDNSERFGRALESESRLLDSLCTSPLKKHTKSPTLWSHRRWLISTYWSHLQSANHEIAASSSFVERELDIVMKAGDRHPKNYYAWDYARKFLKMAMRKGNLADDLEDRLAFVMEVHAWCTKHPSDISGWMFLLFLLRVMAMPEISKVTLERTIDFVEKLHLRGEAVWAFLRGAMRHNPALKNDDAHRLRTRMCDNAETLQMSMLRDQP